MDRLKVGTITFCAVLLLNFLFGKFPSFLDLVYTNGLFAMMRILYDFTLGWLPFPALYLILPFYLCHFFKGQFKTLKSFAKAVLSCILWTINLFYLCWGFNYQQMSIYERAGLTRVQLDSVYIKQTFLSQTQLLDSLVEYQHQKNKFRDLESEIRPIQEQIISEWGVSTKGRVRVRKMFGGFLLHFRTTGIYIPHVFEGHIDGGTYYKQHPFTLAHEMAHGYGFTDESVCNFIGYLSCIRSDNALIRYSAELAYWRYLSGYYRYFYGDEWDAFYEGLHPEIKNDLKEIRAHIESYSDWMPKYRDLIYDRYLKSHGVVSGLRSYNEMILLIAAYRQQGNNPD